MKSAEYYKSEAKRHAEAEEESFQRCDTDGCYTQWAHGLNQRLNSELAKIAENGGVWEFPALFDLAGNRVKAKVINGKYGACWAFCDDDGQFTGQFITAFPARKSTMRRKGYVEGWEDAPANAHITGGGQGFAGMASCYIDIYRTDGGYPGANKTSRPAMG